MVVRCRSLIVNFPLTAITHAFESALKLPVCDSAGEKVLLGSKQLRCQREHSKAVLALAGMRVVAILSHCPDRDVVLDWPPRAVLKHGSAVERHQKMIVVKHVAFPSRLRRARPFQTLDAAAISAVVSRARSGSGTPRGKRSGVRNAMSSARSLVASRTAMMSSIVMTTPSRHASRSGREGAHRLPTQPIRPNGVQARRGEETRHASSCRRWWWWDIRSSLSPPGGARCEVGAGHFRSLALPASRIGQATG